MDIKIYCNNKHSPVGSHLFSLIIRKRTDIRGAAWRGTHLQLQRLLWKSAAAPWGRNEEGRTPAGKRRCGCVLPSLASILLLDSPHLQKQELRRPLLLVRNSRLSSPKF